MIETKGYGHELRLSMCALSYTFFYEFLFSFVFLLLLLPS
jgi:hypothetical protein